MMQEFLDHYAATLLYLFDISPARKEVTAVCRHVPDVSQLREKLLCIARKR